MKLSNNFSLEEFTRSATADRKGIDNSPPDLAVINLKVLCEEVLQPARDHFKEQFTDVFIKVESNEKLYHYIKENLPFTELIWEYGDDRMPAWVHVALSKHDKRKMIKRFPKGKELK